MTRNDSFTKRNVLLFSSACAVALGIGIACNVPMNTSADIPEIEPVIQHVDMDSELAQMAADIEPAPFVVETEEEIVEYVAPVSYDTTYDTGYSYSAPVYEAPTYSAPSSGSGNFQSDGVWYDNNYRYTWYSSNAAYHYRTPEWTAGTDGIYRDSEGYVVVASSDHAQGTVITDTPFGPAKVYDTGCASGTLDIYTNY